MIREVDIAIVGGGPAGLSTALHLQKVSPRIAARTVVLERETYPREKICAGAIGGRGLRKLAALDLSIDVPMVPLDVVAVKMDGRVMSVREPGLGVVVRRVEFDHALALATAARGVEVRDGCEVERIDVSDDGVRIATATGDEYRARVVVGADGVAGVVRRQTGFPRGALRAQVVECDTPHVAADHPRDTVFFDFDDRSLVGYGWDFPTVVNGQPLVCRGVYAIKQWAGRPATEENVRTTIDGYLARRGLAARDADGKPAYRMKQFAEQGFEPGAPIAKPRVLLVGEAAGIDIATGEGIAQAIEFGSVAGPYLARAVADDDLSFADWRRRVDLDHVGWQLRIRHTCFKAFYGPRRPRLESIVSRMTTLLRVGTRDFAGAPQSALDVIRGTAQLFSVIAREGLRRRPS
jgi:flavin-dependent dehydrogenase